MADQIVVDLTNYKDRVGARVAPGTYTVVVEDAETAKSKAGNPMIQTWLRIVGGQFDGQTIVDRLTLSENAMFRVVGFMQGIGLPTPKKRLNLSLSNIVGKKLQITVEDGEPYNGRIKSEVRDYIKLEKQAKPASELDEDEFGDTSEAEGLTEAEPAVDDFEDTEATTGIAGELPTSDGDVTPRGEAASKAIPKADKTPAPQDIDVDEIDL